MKRVLVIQTAYIGDAILATSLLEAIHQRWPETKIDLLLRAGHQQLFEGHPFLSRVLTWNKKERKYAALFGLLKEVRATRYDAVFNLHRYAASGLLTAFSGALVRVGYRQNPLSFGFTRKVNHRFGSDHAGVHEVDRVLDLLEDHGKRVMPRLYLSEEDRAFVQQFKVKPYITIAPASVWFTKQWPIEKWTEFIDRVPENIQVYLIGSPSDVDVTRQLVDKTARPVTDLAGRMKLLQTAALLEDAEMNYANDSAPVHLASAVGAPMCQVFCSTVPEFGFTPLSDKTFVVETDEQLSCRPCGIHGHAACPKQHFKCARSVKVEQLLKAIPAC